MEKFHFYLWPKKFIFRTDHAAFRWFNSMQKPRAMEERWLGILANYDFETVFRPGSKHTNADALSRLPHIKDMEEAKNIEEVRYIQTISEMDKNTWAEQVAQDTELSVVKDWIVSGKPQSQEIYKHSRTLLRYYQIYETLSISNGVIYTTITSNTDPGQVKMKLCVPTSLQQQLVKEIHENSHQGLATTRWKAGEKYFFPGLYSVCQKVVRQCQVCQKMADKPKEQKYVLKDTSSGYPWQKVSCDICGPLPETSKGNKYIITFKDCFTRFLEAYAIPDATATTTADIISEKIIARYGAPEVLLTDNGRNFTSKEIKSLCEALDITKTFTTPYNPKANGIVERAHRDLKKNLVKMMKVTGKEWDKQLAHTVLTLNTAINRTTGVSPYFALYGRNPVMPYDIVFGEQVEKGETAGEYGDRLKEKLTKVYTTMRKNNKSTHEVTKKYYVDKKLRTFAVGDLVCAYYDIPTKGKPKKLSEKFLGPFQVTAKLGDLIYEIVSHGSWRKPVRTTIQIDRLRPWREAVESIPNSEVLTNEQEEDEQQIQKDQQQQQYREPAIDNNKMYMQFGMPMFSSATNFDYNVSKNVISDENNSEDEPQQGTSAKSQQIQLENRQQQQQQGEQDNAPQFLKQRKDTKIMSKNAQKRLKEENERKKIDIEERNEENKMQNVSTSSENLTTTDSLNSEDEIMNSVHQSRRSSMQPTRRSTRIAKRRASFAFKVYPQPQKRELIKKEHLRSKIRRKQTARIKEAAAMLEIPPPRPSPTKDFFQEWLEQSQTQEQEQVKKFKATAKRRFSAIAIKKVESSDSEESWKPGKNKKRKKQILKKKKLQKKAKERILKQREADLKLNEVREKTRNEKVLARQERKNVERLKNIPQLNETPVPRPRKWENVEKTRKTPAQHERPIPQPRRKSTDITEILNEKNNIRKMLNRSK